MAEQAYAYVTLIPVAKGFQGAIAKELGGVNNVGKKAGDDAGKGFSGGFGGAIKGIVALAGTALATIGVGRFFSDAVSESSRLDESLNAVSVAYGEASASIVKLGEDAATRLGVSQATFNEAAVRFSAFSQRVVGEGGNQAKFMDDITTRATDFASVFNIDVSEALQVFQSGLSGEAEPLKRFGINLLDSEVQAYAMANGIGEVGRQLTETEKVQARYGLLMESTSKTQGDFANTSDGLANSQRILKANFEDMQAQVGGALTPALASLTTALLPVVEQLGAQLTPTMEALSPVITQIAGMLPELLVSFMPMIPVLGQVAGLFLELVQAVLPFFVELIMMIVPIIQQLVPLFVAFFDSALEPLMGVLYLLAEALMPVVEALLPVFADLIVALAPVVVDLFYALEPLIIALLPVFIMLVELLTPLLILVANIFSTVLVVAVNLFVGAVTWLTNTISAFVLFFQTAWEGVSTFFTTTGEGITSVLSSIGGFFQSIYETYILPFFEGMQLFLGIIAGLFVMLWEFAIQPVLGWIGDAFVFLYEVLIKPIIDGWIIIFQALGDIFKWIWDNMLSPVIQALGDMFTWLWETIISPVINFIIGGFEWLAEMAGIIFGGIALAFETVWGGIKDFFENIVNGIIIIFEGMVNLIIKGLNWLIKQINKISIDIPDSEIFGQYAGTTFGFNLPEIPDVSLGRVEFAKGGFVTGPTNALIGEAGPEVVIPLDRFERMMGLDKPQNAVNYYAAPNHSLSSEEELFLAMRRAKLVVA